MVGYTGQHGENANRAPSAAVGVIIPLFNKEKQVRRALESVLMQSFSDYEVVVIDDGSTDFGPDVVQEMPDERITLIRQENAGVGAARNRGAAHRRFEILAFLDADDEWLPEQLAWSINHFENHPECAAVVRRHLRGSERTPSDDFSGIFGMRQGVWRLPTTFSGPDFKRALNACTMSSSMCRQAVFDRYGGFYAKDKCNWGEDAYFWAQVLLNHPVYVDDRPGAWYHREDSGLFRPDSILPPEPALFDTGQLWENCPQEYRGVLRRYLVFQARSTITRLAKAGDSANATSLAASTSLWGDHPLEKFRTRLILLNPKIMLRWHMPAAYRALKRAKQTVQRVWKGRDAAAMSTTPTIPSNED